MISNTQMLTQIDTANRFIDKHYLDQLNEYSVRKLDDFKKRNNVTKLYHITKIVYDKNEDINEKMISVLSAVTPFCRNIIFILKGEMTYVDLYIGIRASQISNTEISAEVLHDSFLGNFPGSKMVAIDERELDSIFNKREDNQYREYNSRNNVAYINILPSERKNQQGKYIQGLEKFVDTMRGSEYICEILASPIKDIEIEKRLNGFEELYSALYPFSKKTSSHGHNEGSTLTEGINESISDSISRGISNATGINDGHSYGKSSGMNMGAHMLLNFGINNSINENWNTGSSETNTYSENKTRTDSFGRQKSTSVTSGVTDNITIEFKDKAIEDLLEKIDCHIKRLKTGSSYGMWEIGTYFIAEERRTVAMAASTYRSILLGEDSGIEKSNFTLFDAVDDKTERIEECLRYFEHPLFNVPYYDAANKNILNSYLASTSFVNGKELVQLFNLPRKSVNGVMVTKMAEFGRNVLVNNNYQSRTINLGNIYHMGEIEKSQVKLDLDSLASHCFVTGSTGSGKSNTIYKIIEEISKEPYKIPFLIIEPAKGEYRNEFRNLENINLFTTNPQIDQMLKLNPFAFCEDIHILEHLDRLIEIFNGCWEMYAAMPAILKEAIEESYISKGWDLLNSVYVGKGEVVFPTFIDVLRELPRIINNSEYSADTKGDYIGALVTRVNSMTNGIYGQIFCDEFEIDNNTLFDERTIVDLSRIGSSETKSLIMGVLILKLSEYRMAKAGKVNSKLKHVTVIEEAHNILKNSKSIHSSLNNSVISKSVEMITNSIAEMRTYGEGFIIVDQSPTSVDIAAIKNTNTKIIMRLPEEDDCKIIGHSVSLTEEQIDELSKLETGVAVVMQNNWIEPVLSKVEKANHRYEGFEKVNCFNELKAFRSAVLSALIEQYERTEEQKVEKIIEIIDNFEITLAKKIEMKRMIIKFHNVMSKGYDSVLFGRTMLRLIGCNDVFKKAERRLRNKVDENGKKLDDYTEESLRAWKKEIDTTLSNYVSIENTYREIMRQYILHSKKFESSSISYNVLYQQIYKQIR